MVRKYMLSIFLLSAFVAIIMLIAYRHNQSEVQLLFDTLESEVQERAVEMIDYDSIGTLPEPVQRYFKYTLGKQRYVIQKTQLRQTGLLKVNPAAEEWSEFSARQSVATATKSFVWDAKVKLPAALHIRVVDSLLHGTGAGKVSIQSVLMLGSESDQYELNSAALYRYLAEAVWHPTSLLPQSGVQWKPVDDNRAIASINSADISISLEFRFNEIGEITGMYTDGRYARFTDRYAKYPWEGWYSNYAEIDGVKIPLQGEVGWHLNDGWWLFWKGEISQAEFFIGLAEHRTNGRVTQEHD